MANKNIRHRSPVVLALLDIDATNSCILCTAHDANMRDFKVTVLSSCAARTAREHKEVIENISEMAGARAVTLASLRLPHSKGAHGKDR